MSLGEPCPRCADSGFVPHPLSAQRRQGEKKNKYGACAVKKKKKMQFRFYAIPIAGDKTVEDELNAFVRSHKIVAIDKQFSDKDSAWVFCITYIENSVATSGSFQSKKEKIDYKEVLDEQTFDTRDRYLSRVGD